MHKHFFLWLLFLSVLVSASFQGSRGLYETTEGRYSECARQTNLAEDWDDPVLNEAYHWTKPPLTYMAISAGIKLFGNNNWGVRFYLILSFVLTVVTVYLLGRHLWGPGAAPFCALVYCSSPFTVAAANVVSTDTLLTLWMSLSMLMFWWGLRSEKGWAFMLMWTALGFSFFTKGPTSLLPLGAFIPTYHFMKKDKENLPRFFTLSGVLLFVVTGLSWYIAEALEHSGLLRYWIIGEVIQRNIQGGFHRNPEFYYALIIYLPILCLGTGPWALLLCLKGRKLFWPAGRWLRPLQWPHGIEWTFLFLSVFVPLTIFSLSKSKLPLYMLPLFIPISLAMGKAIEHLVASRSLETDTVLRLAGGVIVLLVAIKAISPYIASASNMEPLARQLQARMEACPEAPLYLYHRKGRHLNGLQFYLQRVIPPVPLEVLPDKMQLTPQESDRICPPLLLTRRKDLLLITMALDPNRIKINELNQYWLLIEYK